MPTPAQPACQAAVATSCDGGGELGPLFLLEYPYRMDMPTPAVVPRPLIVCEACCAELGAASHRRTLYPWPPAE